MHDRVVVTQFDYNFCHKYIAHDEISGALPFISSFLSGYFTYKYTNCSRYAHTKKRNKAFSEWAASRTQRSWKEIIETVKDINAQIDEISF